MEIISPRGSILPSWVWNSALILYLANWTDVFTSYSNTQLKHYFPRGYHINCYIIFGQDKQFATFDNRNSSTNMPVLKENAFCHLRHSRRHLSQEFCWQTLYIQPDCSTFWMRSYPETLREVFPAKANSMPLFPRLEIASNTYPERDFYTIIRAFFYNDWLLFKLRNISYVKYHKFVLKTRGYIHI